MAERRGGSREELVGAGSPDRFGFEWDRYSEMRPEYEEQFRRWTLHLERGDWTGRAFLDVGCGMGRNSYWPMVYGAARGVAIDVDPRSVAAARWTLAPFSKATVLLASGYDIPFRNAFDIVFSIGVVHHVESPEKVLAEMVCATKPGGLVLIWVYGRENNEWIVRLVSPLRKALLGRLPIGIVHFISLGPAALLWVILRCKRDGTEYIQFLRGCSFRHLRSIVFDQLLPRIAHYWSRETVEEMLAKAGLKDVKLAWVNQVSWSAVGRKSVELHNGTA
ncbi:MAG TPA: class I SAM-dependent methyltransferase [Methylomirabilota bacterium]|nr:class I SAM-dependent methyltransferase [Methylomirabilota bacterium]